jgi:DNA N-6-adenine-methyltransferase (Dam)
MNDPFNDPVFLDTRALSESKRGKSNEWFTPSKYIEAARAVLGSIDLDPASCELANQVVKATRYYTREQNGLAQDWTCTSMWLNPPYGRKNGSGSSVIRCFVSRLIREYETGNIYQAITLLPTQTNASWFQCLWEFPLCFASHRLHFVKPRGNDLREDGRTSHTLGTIFAYLGPYEQRFIEHFSKFGRIVRAIDTPPTKLVTRELWTEVKG